VILQRGTGYSKRCDVLGEGKDEVG
jgi:hypothetical protein